MESTEMARALERMLDESGALDLGTLCVVAGRQCWVLWIDCLVLEAAGNILDTCALAMCATPCHAMARLPLTR